MTGDEIYPERRVDAEADAKILTFWNAWIENIIIDVLSGDCPMGIVEHIQKHAGADLRWLFQTPLAKLDPKDLRRWSASMHNLLAMFDHQYLGEPITTEEKVARLQAHYDQHGSTRTGPPGGERRTIAEWGAITGRVVLDPDGFNRWDGRLMERLFTREEFEHGCLNSTSLHDCTTQEILEREG